MDAFVVVSVLVGTLFIAAGLVITLVRDDLNNRAFWIVRLMVSLGAGLAAAGMLGGLEIEGQIMSLSIKAGGPFAVWVITYLLNPPDTVQTYVAGQ